MLVITSFVITVVYSNMRNWRMLRCLSDATLLLQCLAYCVRLVEQSLLWHLVECHLTSLKLKISGDMHFLWQVVPFITINGNNELRKITKFASNTSCMLPKCSAKKKNLIYYSWFQTSAMVWMLYSFILPAYTAYEDGTVCSKMLTHKIPTPVSHPREGI